MGELGTVSLSDLVRRTAQASYVTLQQLVATADQQSDTEKKLSLLKYIDKTRQRLLRLHVLTQWCNQTPVVQCLRRAEETSSNIDLCFTQAADSLFFTHHGLQQACAPVYDVPSALEVLATGSYNRLPKCIEDIGKQTVLEGEELELALPKLDTLLRSQLLEISLPKEISAVTVSDGRVVLRVDGEFKVQVTLGYRGHSSLWRILHLELLVGETSGPLKLDERQRFSIGDDLERRMAAAENPFATLYSVLHEFCIALVMDTVIKQVKTLIQGRWKDAIRFDLISDINSGQEDNIGHPQGPPDGEADIRGMKTPGIQIMYWLDCVKGTGGGELGCVPFIKIEVGQDQHIICSHNIFVIDPMTGNEAEFVLKQSCIDVEYLLLRAISCNIHTRLLEVQRVLKSNSQLCQAEDDIILEHPGNDFGTPLNKISDVLQKNIDAVVGELGEELLCVRAYGLSYVVLGISIRNGRFLLSSRNLILSSAITECEEALNQGSLALPEVFISLRRKSILHLFASIGRFLGLKVYENGLATVKIPKSIRKASDFLLMGIPNCSKSCLLLIQLDVDFMPLFTMLESRQDSTGCDQIFRFRKIDVGRNKIVEEEVNLSLFYNEWSLHSARETRRSDIISESGPNSESFTDGTIQGQERLSAFSSVVDDTFKFDKGMSLPWYLPKQKNDLSSAEPIPSSAGQGMQQDEKFGLSNPRWDGISQFPLTSNTGNASVGGFPFDVRMMSELNKKKLWQTGSSPLSGGHSYGLNRTSLAGSQSFDQLSSASKNFSDQELIFSKSPLHLGDHAAYPVMDENELGKVIGSPKDGLPIYSSNRQTYVPSLHASSAHRSPIQNSRSYPKSSPTGQPETMLKSIASGSCLISPMCQTSDCGTSLGNMSVATPKHGMRNRKRKFSDLVQSIPSLQQTEAHGQSQKKRKTLCESGNPQPINAQLNTQGSLGQFVGRLYGDVVMEANHGKAPSRIYTSVLLQVVKRCSLFIKHEYLANQMTALGIAYIEDTGFHKPSADFWFQLPSCREHAWKNIGLWLGNPCSTYWDVRVNDDHFRDLWELHKGMTGTPWGSGVCIANNSDADSHIQYGPEGVVLSYRTVEENSAQKAVADLQRLSKARSFAMGMRRLLEVKPDEKIDTGKENCNMKTQNPIKKGAGEGRDRMCRLIGGTFRIEAVGLMSLQFSYFGLMSGSIAHFAVEWETGKEGCTMRVSPDQLWPHTKFLEDFIDGGEVGLLLDCIRLTAEPLHVLSGIIRPAGMVGTASTGIGLVPSEFPITAKTNKLMVSQGLAQSTESSSDPQAIGGISGGAPSSGASGNLNTQNGSILSSTGRGPAIVPSSLLPTDVSVVLRSPYWIRIIYRKKFAVDMRCFAGDQVWLQPAIPPKSGAPEGDSILYPQFQQVIVRYVDARLNTLETHLNPYLGVPGTSDNSSINAGQSPVGSANEVGTLSPGISQAAPLTRREDTIVNRVTNVKNALETQRLAAHNAGITLVEFPKTAGTGLPVDEDEERSIYVQLGNDSGYGGGWVPLASLKNVLRGIVKYLGVLWSFYQLLDILRSTLKGDGESVDYLVCDPALSFRVRGHVYEVSFPDLEGQNKFPIQLRMRGMSVENYNLYSLAQQQQQTLPRKQTNSQDELIFQEIRELCDLLDLSVENYNLYSLAQQQQEALPRKQTNSQDELNCQEIGELCDFFSRRVVSEPYDASKIASFVTLLLLPISVLREFLKLIAWKQGIAQAQSADSAPSERPRVELCLDSHLRSNSYAVMSLDDAHLDFSDKAASALSKSNIRYDRPHNAVDFELIVFLDPAYFSCVNAASGASGLPQCVSLRLKYAFGENPHVSVLSMERSHRGCASGLCTEDWERCKQRVVKAVEIAGRGSGVCGSSMDVCQGRLRAVAETLQHYFQSSLLQL